MLHRLHRQSAVALEFHLDLPQAGLRVGNSAAQAGVANSKTGAITASRRMTGISLADPMRDHNTAIE